MDSAASTSIDDATRHLEKLDFHHPYTPYAVQEEFMKTVYSVLDKGEGQIGILESPTGTGKSLSLICASLTWLRNFKSNRFEVSIKNAGEAYKDEPSWLVDQLLRRKREELVQRWEDRERRLEAIRSREKEVEERGRKRRRLEVSTAPGQCTEMDPDEAEWLLDDWEDRDTGVQDALSGLSKESREVLERIGLGGPRKKEEDNDILEEEIKIYYTSRTHSQLSQFIAELRRPSFPSSLPISLTEEKSPAQEPVKLLPLSSRQRLCINPSVAKLGSVQAINDRCAELQQSRSTKKCSYVPKEELLSQTHQFRDSALATVPDIEDLHQLGKSLAVCPYYASRSALPGAEVITLPYPLLLQRSAREALGIKLEGNVVIIDEAHNVMDAVANVHAAEINLCGLRKGRGMLGVYVKRFGKKLTGANRVNVGRLGRVIDGLTEWMDGAKGFEQQHGIVDANDLTRRKGIDQINMFELIRYIQESKLAYKIESYAAHVDGEKESAKQVTRSSSPVLHALVSFLVALTNPSSEGRIFYQKTAEPGQDVQLSYLLLSPTHAFSSIVSSARAVILAGGTMSPFDDYKNHLFPTLADAKVTTLSCGHVVPRENLCVWTLAGTRPGGPSFEFSYRRRGDQEMVRELGLSILNICSIVPDGVVVFFPSYGYLEEVVAMWSRQSPGDKTPQATIWDRLQARKMVFRETRGCSSDEVLSEYTRAILGNGASATSPVKGKGGAVLLSVVGGKMSEGINFSDRLGRCVMVVGLPYPNIASPEWKAKTEYIESTAMENLQGSGNSAGSNLTKEEAVARAKQAARDFYENACMRAVNQSIGRAIRHRGDYAAIVLVDRRYATDRIQGKLPGWIQSGMETRRGGGDGDGKDGRHMCRQFDAFIPRKVRASPRSHSGIPGNSPPNVEAASAAGRLVPQREQWRHSSHVGAPRLALPKQVDANPDVTCIRQPLPPPRHFHRNPRSSSLQFSINQAAASIKITMITVPRASVRLVRNHVRPAATAIAAPRGFSGTARRQTYEDDASGQELPPSKSNLAETLRKNWVPIGGAALFAGLAYAYFSSPGPNKASEKDRLSRSEAKQSK
ncbi:DEAD-2 domain-containing protein [Metarhizium album ARSEF 1941]|uniref:ATP-dependent DNA helicase CHL1 n=1 Tax=Metarhizium album (strain ARSEF 1941) TaxID=1081103 RepID=A0A0B2WUY8_METAS|nr:DEAD-2 domain-containing protein [Metarhizium album ARSEF 1941]KHN97459.1 DEAD-2 domain-containing protein [Metarhizium album ARSEF 1941]